MAETINEKGWLHIGDICGEVDRNQRVGSQGIRGKVGGFPTDLLASKFHHQMDARHPQRCQASVLLMKACSKRSHKKN